MKQENPDADGDGTVRNVKGRPVKVPDVEIEEIGHLSESDPIDQIADGSAEDHGKSTGQMRMRCRRFEVKPQDQAHCQKGKEQKHHTAQTRIRTGQETERTPGILNVREVEKTGNDRNGMIQRQVSQNQHLGELIEQYNHTGNQKQFDRFAFHPALMLFRAVWQRLQIVG